MIRLVHFSDIHLTTRPLGFRCRDWFNKRLPGWINLRWLGRQRRFAFAEEVLGALVSDLRRQPSDRVILSGDATALGFESEIAREADILGLADNDSPLPGLAVPGNHDYYTRDVAAAGLFERYFAPWQTGLRLHDSRY